MAVVIALLSLLLMSALGAALVLTTSSESMIAANFGGAQEGLYAADAVLERAVDDLAAIADWNGVLAGATRSAFVDGAPGGVRPLADGSLLDLDAMLNLANCRQTGTCSQSALTAITSSRPWGANNPIWQLFAYGRLASLLPAGMIESAYYVVVMAADDHAETDGDPRRDGDTAENPGSGVLSLRAQAFGPRSVRQLIELTVARAAPDAPEMRIVAWRLIR